MPLRVLLTGGHGFVGRRLQTELTDAGLIVRAPPSDQLDVTDAASVTQALADGVDAVVHLAAVAFGPDADADPALALRVNVGGTLTLVEALRQLPNPPIVLVVGSADVYAVPRGAGATLSEASPLGIRGPYGLTKVAQEAVAMDAAARESWRLVVIRAFNHSGPGQRRDFVVPAMAERVRAVLDGRADAIPVGNLDVRRDLLHVDDVVHAYRLVLEALADGRVAHGGVVLNVASGRTVSIREVVEGFQRRAGTSAPLRVDARFVRADDPPEILGDASRLRTLTGWRPTRNLDEILDDVWADVTTDVPAP
jgi:GDP-4-dehydro-6-deoxy-D-mannose reductase